MTELSEAIAGMTLRFVPAEKQIEVAEEAAACGRFGLFTQVGTGKTFISTAASLTWEVDHIIVVSPPILSRSWQRWLTGIGQPDTEIYAGPDRKVGMLDHKWVMMSHAIFRLSFSTILKFYAGKRVALIVDEAQALKNVQSKLYKSVKTFIQPDRNLLLLSATPTTKPEDTYAYISLKTPHVYRNISHWENVHVTKYDVYDKPKAYDNLELLASNFALNAAKLSKRDIFGDAIPDPIYDPIEYDLSPAHYALYKRLAEEQLLMLDNGQKIDATSAQKLRHALQQIVVNYEKFTGNESDRSTSYDLLDSVIDQIQPMDHANSKLVVWSWYKHTSAKLTAYLTEKYGKAAVCAAYGGVNSQKAVDRIMFDPETRFMIAQPTSVGAGLDLQEVCNEMLLLEMSTVPMHIRQLIGRVDRLGQRGRPTIRFGIAKDTIQLDLYERLLENDQLVSKVERTIDDLRRMIYGVKR